MALPCSPLSEGLGPLFGRGKAVGLLFPKLCHVGDEHHLSGSYHKIKQHEGEDIMYNLTVKKRGGHLNDILPGILYGLGKLVIGILISS